MLLLCRARFSTAEAKKSSTTIGLSIERMLKKTQQAYPNCLTLIQIGDFYEMLDADARKGSEILGITLTKRDRGKAKEKDMAGIPCKSLKTYLAKFAKHGEKVVVVDQIGEKSTSTVGNMHREVVRVVTPGTLCEDELLNPGEDNFLASCVLLPNSAGEEETVALAWTDVSTTDGVSVQSIRLAEAEEALRKISPKEVLLRQDQLNHMQAKLPWLWDAARRQEHVVSIVDAPVQHSAKSTKRFSSIEQQALLCLQSYVDRTLMPKHFDWTNQRTMVFGGSEQMQMMIDTNTRNALEISKSNNTQSKTLFSQLDYTVTAGGTRLLRSRLESPSLNKQEIKNRFDSVDYLLAKPEYRYGSVQQRMRALRDPTRALQRLIVGRWGPKDLHDIFLGLHVGRLLASEVLAKAPALELSQCSQTLTGMSINEPAAEGLEMLRRNGDKAIQHGIFNSAPHALTSLSALHQELHNAFAHEHNLTGEDLLTNESLDRPRLFTRGYNSKYDELIDRVNSTTTIATILQRYQAEYHFKIRIQFTEKAGHFVEVPKSVIPVLQQQFSHVFRAMRVGAGRFTTEELDQFNRTHKLCDEELSQCEQLLLNHLCALVLAQRHALSEAFHSLSVVDVAASSARAARELKLIRPDMFDNGLLELEHCRHVVVEQNNANFVGNDLLLRAEGKPSVYLITGPNMGGKSTFLRSCALVPIMAQSGMFVPCTNARVGLVDRIFARIGASDDLVNNRSTFMVEMEETANLLQNATSRSMVIVDELGRGTSPQEGLCIAQAVLEELVNIGCRTLFATHFHTLTAVEHGPLEQSPEQIEPYTAEVVVLNEHDIVFTFKMLPGIAKSSFGMNVARLAGIPPAVLDRAGFLLNKK